MAKAKKEEGKDKKEVSPLERLAKSRPEYIPLCDNPLSAEDYAADQLDLAYKLGPVYHYLRQPNTPTPLTVAIYGSWGTGKTSAMRCMHGMIDTWNEEGKAAEGQEKIKLRPVWFYPWKYHTKQDVWRGLISEVILGSTDVKNATPKRIADAMLRFGGFLGRSFLQALCAPKVTFKAEAGVGAKAGMEAEYDLADLKDRILAEYHDVAHPEKEFLNEFEAALSSWVKNTIVEQKERMVIFIDDLDRCMPKVALEVLEALKLYLNIEGMVFVVGVDRTVVDSLVGKHYQGLGLSEDTSARYLDKMFQVEVYLSPTDTQIEAFLQSLLGEEQSGMKGVEEKERSIFCKVILNLAKQNPRETKRLLSSALMVSLSESIGADATSSPKPRFSTAQAIQYCLVHRIMFSYGLASLLAERRTREFFFEWSKILHGRENVEDLYKDALRDRTAEEQRDKEEAPDVNAESKKDPLRDLLDSFPEVRPKILMADKNLRDLMAIQFPKPEVTELLITLSRDLESDSDPVPGFMLHIIMTDPEKASQLLMDMAPDSAINVLSRVHPSRAATVLMSGGFPWAANLMMLIHSNDAVQILQSAGPSWAAEVLERGDSHWAVNMLLRVPPETAAALLNHFHRDMAVDLLDLARKINSEHAERIAAMLGYRL